MIQLKHYTVKRLCLKIIEKRPKFAVSGKGELGSFVPIIANHETSTCPHMNQRVGHVVLSTSKL